MLKGVRQQAFWLTLMFCLVGVLAVFTPQKVFGEISSCTANSDPQEGDTSQSFNVDFEVTNEDVNPAAYIKIARPSSDVVIESVSVENWSVSGTEDYVELVGSSLGGGEVLTLTFTVSIQGGVDVNGNWDVSVSEGSSGLEPTSCSGDLSLTASATLVPASISNIHITNLSTDQATVNWTTDEGATSQVYFGETSSYGESSTNQTTLSTSHSVSITNLTPNTAYHYQVRSVDSDGNESLSSDNTFLTPNGNVSNTPSTPTLTGLVGIKTVPTEKIPPAVTLLTDISKPQKTIPTLSGTAEDNEAIAGVFYSLDGGKNWLLADTATGLGTKKATFSFTPQNLKDGNFKLIVSAIDTSSNQASTPAQTLVIDRLPPTVGGSVITIGSQVLVPGDNNVINSIVGVEQKITLSAVGGPISVVVDTTRVGMSEQLQSFSLTQSAEDGLWSGILSFSKAGNYQLVIHALDGAGNKTERKLDIVSVSEAGEVTNSKGTHIANASITVFERDTETNSWGLWDGEAYDQSNPTTVNAKSEYGLYLPEGTYYLKIQAPDYRTVVTHSFKLTSSKSFSANFKLSRKPGFDLGPIHVRLPWPTLSSSTFDEVDASSSTQKNSAVDSSLPQFTLIQTNNQTVSTKDLYGKPTVLTFVNTWSGLMSTQLDNLGSLNGTYINVLAVSSGESKAKLQSYANLASYSSPIVVDSDNTLIDNLGGSAIPVTYFIDRHGVVKKVMVGVLSKEELLKNITL